MTFTIDRIDHVVVNCADVETSADWYARVFRASVEPFGIGGQLVRFGRQKLNLRPTGEAKWFTAAADEPGSLDICFITTATPDEVVEHLRTCEVAPELGPVSTRGALGAMTSVYCRDPDGNLIEFASYDNEEAVAGGETR
jgi:catechol 2,3-dioxygenase-like lactoylglutathione lyase family enzyme